MRWTRGLSGITLAIHAAGRSGRGLLNKTVGEPETWWALLSFSQLKLSQSFAIDNLQISCFGHTLPFKSLGSIRFFLRMFLNKSLMLTKAEFIWLKSRLKSSNIVKYYYNSIHYYNLFWRKLKKLLLIMLTAYAVVRRHRKTLQEIIKDQASRTIKLCFHL